MGCYVLGFEEIDQTQIAIVGGKGAHLGELRGLSAVASAKAESKASACRLAFA